MSSPLSSLRKTQKNPLTISQKATPSRSPEYSHDENKLLDEITNSMANQRIRNRDPFQGGLPKLTRVPHFHSSPRASNASSLSRYHDIIPTFERPHSAASSVGSEFDNGRTFLTNAPSDSELMQAMMNRLTLLEKNVSYQNKEILEKDKKIRILEEKIRLLQKAQDGNQETRANEAEKKCLLLEQKVHEMENFLADYGMVWVGDQEDPESEVYNEETSSSVNSEDEQWRPGSSVSTRAARESTIDFDLIIKNVEELNYLAGDGKTKIQHTSDGARLKHAEFVPLTLYRNGMMLFSGPFRPFSDPSTQQCLQDIIDGYFPSELQTKYPDGIPFVVKDLRDTFYKQEKRKVFTGAGHTLGGDTKPSRLVPTNLDKYTSTQGAVEREDTDTVPVGSLTSERPGHQLTVDQFLKKLPKSVVKNGKVIDIRNSVGETIKGGSVGGPEMTIVETEVVKSMKERLKIDEHHRPKTPRNITTLRVMSDVDHHTYMLKMKYEETIADLKKYINVSRGGNLENYKIFATFPNRELDNDGATLQQCGLVPNAVLHLKTQKS